jgi:hypothetical protein
MNQGWGIHITEGPNWFMIGMVNFFVVVLSGVAAGLWSLYRHDFQGAFGFAGWIVAVESVVLLVCFAKWNGT